jgi:hypothetical protein
MAAGIADTLIQPSCRQISAVGGRGVAVQLLDGTALTEVTFAANARDTAMASAMRSPDRCAPDAWHPTFREMTKEQIKAAISQDFVALPFRIIGLCFGAVLAVLRTLMFLPARVVGHRG